MSTETYQAPSKPTMVIQVEVIVLVYLQEIDEVERKHLVALRELLNKSAHLWPRHASIDFEDMSHLIIHHGAKVGVGWN